MYNEDAGRLMLLTFPIIMLCITTGLCAPCPDGCARGCTEAKCTSCIAGRYGVSCNHSCRPFRNCLDNECERLSGHRCERGCNPGFIYFSGRCHYKCPHTCRTCEIRSSREREKLCTSCNGGYTGYPHCQYSCIGCNGTFCNDNEGSGQCTLGCMEGYFTNSAMNYSGRIRISDETPVIEISICKKCKDKCSSCSSLEYCTSCIPGTYGQSCEHTCDPNCRNTACNSTTGVCENECSSGYYTNWTTCESCPTCDDCKTDPCKSSCCQATTPSICSVKNCDVCSEIDLDRCKECLYDYRLTGNGTCESNSGLLTSCTAKGDDDDIAIGFAIGSSICLLTIVAVLVIAIVVTKRKRLRQKSRNQTETGEHVYLNDAFHESSRNTDGNSQNIGGNSQNTEGKSQNTEGNSQNTDVNSQNTDVSSQNTDVNSQNTDVNSQNTDVNSQNTMVNSQNTDGNSQNTDGNSQNTDGNSQKTDGNSQKTDGNSQNTDGNYQNTDGNSKNTDGNSKNTDGNSQNTDGISQNIGENSQNIDGNYQNTDGNSQKTAENSQNTGGNSQNTDGNSQNIGGNSGNINGESKTEIRTTSTNNDDIDQHEYDHVDNPVTGIGTTDYEALRPVSRDEHVYEMPEESAYINVRV